MLSDVFLAYVHVFFILLPSLAVAVVVLGAARAGLGAAGLEADLALRVDYTVPRQLHLFRREAQRTPYQPRASGQPGEPGHLDAVGLVGRAFLDVVQEDELILPLLGGSHGVVQRIFILRQ